MSNHNVGAFAPAFGFTDTVTGTVAGPSSDMLNGRLGAASPESARASAGERKAARHRSAVILSSEASVAADVTLRAVSRRWIPMGVGAAAFVAAVLLWPRQPSTPPMPDAAMRDSLLAFARARVTGTEAAVPAFEARG